MIPEYLPSEEPRAIILMDYGVPLGRRFRALKLWFVMRYFGLEGLQKLCARISRGRNDWPRWWIRIRISSASHPCPFPWCASVTKKAMTNRRIEEAINGRGKFFISHTALNGHYVLRVTIGNLASTWQDVEELWREIQALGSAVAPAG